MALAAGIAASSAALIAFGGDSLIEVSSAVVVIWQFRSRAPRTAKSVPCGASRSVSSQALAAYVAVDATRTLLGAAEVRHAPSRTRRSTCPILVIGRRMTARSGPTRPTCVNNSSRRPTTTRPTRFLTLQAWWPARPMRGDVLEQNHVVTHDDDDRYHRTVGGQG